MDWPYWRGPEMNGVSRETGIVEKWSPTENLLWKNEEAAARSTPIVMNGHVYIIVRDQPESKKEGEKVLCLDAKTGEKKWENRFNVFLSDVPDTRVGWSSVCGDPSTGNVFAHGVCGLFQCIDGKTGKTLWSHSLFEEYGTLSTYGGRTNFPIVYGDIVITSAIVIGWGDQAKPAHRFIAFDKRNGQPVWFEGTRVLPYDTTYSAPVIARIGDQDQFIVGSGDGGVHGFQPLTGKKIWNYNVSRRGINTTPLVHNGTVFGGHSEENIDDTKMGALFALDPTKSGDITKSGEKWRVKEWFVGKSAPLVVDNRLYACEDGGTMLIVDLETGQEIKQVKLGGPMRGSLLYADGKIFAATENGRWWTFKPTEDGVETLHRARLRIGSVNGSPIVSHGRLYVPTTDALYCVGKADVEPATAEIPEVPALPDVKTNDKPALVQIVPVESLLDSGKQAQAQRFLVRLFNSTGQYIKSVPAKDVEFTIDGPGSIDKDGRYTAPSGDVHGAVTVTAKYGDLTSKARIRVVPDLNWAFDFESGEIPVSWVGVRYRHVPIDFEYFKKLEAQDALTSQVYLYLQSNFINLGQPEIAFDDSTPRATWSKFLIFLGLTESVRNVPDAEKIIGPALKKLQEDGYLAGSSFSEWEKNGNSGPRLTLKKGDKKLDGNVVMMKITTIPKGTRSQGTMGHVGLSNYTIQADLMGANKEGKLPDMGLIAQRYTIDLMGASQQLQIRTWPPQLRMAQSVPFEWKGNTWYTVKMQASVEGGKAVLRGKVWEKGTEEPKEWMVEAIDETPNLNGSPGLYGNAKDSEIFIDNIRVTTN